jgi:imidazolonepropionase-like amidohydrolase
MRKTGVRIMAGTDVPLRSDVAPLHEELVLLVKAGLSPMEALQSATRNPAEFLGTLRTEGTIEVGKLADLVLLEASPLVDIANTRRIAAVIRAGTLIEPNASQRPR